MRDVCNRITLKFVVKVLGFLGSFLLGTSVTVADCMKTKMERTEMSIFASIVLIQVVLLS